MKQPTVWCLDCGPNSLEELWFGYEQTKCPTYWSEDVLHINPHKCVHISCCSCQRDQIMDQVLGLVTSSGQFKYYYEISVDFGEMVLNQGYADPCGHKQKKIFLLHDCIFCIYVLF